MGNAARYQSFDAELSVLSAVKESQDEELRATQRDLANRAGISLGMANLVLRRLAERGFLELTRFSSKKVKYALTGSGMKELASRAAGLYNRASRNAGLYRGRLDILVGSIARRGAKAAVLVGASEVESLLAESCERAGIVFLKSSDLERARSLARKSGAALVLSENLDTAAAGDDAVEVESLAALLAAMPSAGFADQS